MAVPCCDNPLVNPVVDAARGWVGTPYIHQASRKKIGTDCLGLLRGIWRELIGPEPDTFRAYSPDWAETGGGEALLHGLERHLQRLDSEVAKPGDILLFRMLDRGPAKHLAILATGGVSEPSGTIIHAYSGLSVCETCLSFPWIRRIAGAFRLPAALPR